MEYMIRLASINKIGGTLIDMNTFPQGIRLPISDNLRGLALQEGIGAGPRLRQSSAASFTEVVKRKRSCSTFLATKVSNPGS